MKYDMIFMIIQVNIKRSAQAVGAAINGGGSDS